MSVLLEVCVETVEDACTAAAAGARRLELCRALAVGGVTPSPAMVRAAVEESGVECVALVRPRGGDFLYTARERRVLLAEVEDLRESGVRAVVVGALTPEARLDTRLARDLADAAGPLERVLHRAFDASADLEGTLEEAIGAGFRRVLTSGGAPTAPEGAARIAALVERAAGRIELLPGGGVRAANVRELVVRTGVRQVHASCGAWRAGGMRVRPRELAFGSTEEPGRGNWRVDEDELRRLVEALGSLP